MGDISIIARRLSSDYVQYGYAGNGGYFSNNGRKLLSWYNEGDKKTIDNLFSLGQLKRLGSPGSEKGGEHWFLTHELDGIPHEVGTSEREIFSKILFVDYGYFYDSDNHWYYIVPGPFRIKIRLELVSICSDEKDNEFDFLNTVNKELIRYIFTEYPKQDTEFAALLNGMDVNAICEELLTAHNPVRDFWERYRQLYDYFDNWAVVETVDTNFISFKLRKAAESPETREETINW